jgi:hypothetical protein
LCHTNAKEKKRIERLTSMDVLFICLDMQYASVQITTCKIIIFCSIMLKGYVVVVVYNAEE